MQASRSLVGLAPRDRDKLKLIARRPVPNKQEALGRPLIFRQFASSCDFSNRLGIPPGYELEKILEQFHRIFRFWLGVLLCFQKLTKKCCNGVNQRIAMDE